MRKTKHFGRGLTALAVSLAAFATVATAPVAADTVRLDVPDVEMRQAYECDPGHEWVEMATAIKDATVTHVHVLHGYTGGSARVTKTARHQTTVRAELTTSAQVSFNHNLVFQKLNVTAGVTLKAEAQHTTETNVEIAWDLPKNDTYVFFSGTVTAAGHYDYYRCSSAGKVQFVTSGNVGSWKVEEEGAIGCTQEVPTNSLPAKAKKDYCPPPDAPDANVRVSAIEGRLFMA